MKALDEGDLLGHGQYRVQADLKSEIKAPGMADMPGESQEEPSVMVATILATIR